MKTNIALIGYMGTGKTAVGQMLARRMNTKFIELDWLIEENAGKTIPDIFKDEGEIGFREREIEATKQIAGEQNCVIACGGGLVLNKINVDRLRENGITVYLTASPGEILKRTSREKGTRPLLAVDNPAQTIKEMIKFRQPFYERAADVEINTTRLGLDAVVEEIITELKKDENFYFKE